VLYGIAASTEVAYFTYMYAKVDKEHYKKVTSYTYSALLTGRLLGGASGQILISYDILDYLGLHYVSLGCVSIAFLLSFFLPKVKESIYFYRREEGSDIPEKPSFPERVKRAYPILWRDFKEAYSNSYVLKWSIWWAIATAGHLQAISYVQPLWERIASYQHVEIYNGAVDAIQGALSTTTYKIPDSSVKRHLSIFVSFLIVSRRCAGFWRGLRHATLVQVGRNFPGCHFTDSRCCTDLDVKNYKSQCRLWLLYPISNMLPTHYHSSQVSSASLG